MFKWRIRKEGAQVNELVLTPDDWELDDPAFFEARICNSQIGSWESATDLVTSHGIRIEEIADVARAADPAAGTGAICGLVWGIAGALRVRANDPCDAATWIAGGLEDMSVPDSYARTSRIAMGYGEFAALLLRRWSLVMAIVGSDFNVDVIPGLAGLAKLAGSLRDQEWEILLIGMGNAGGQKLVDPLGYTSVDVEFSREFGWCRVARTSLSHDRDRSAPVVFTVSNVEEGIAVLDLMMANVCIAASGPQAVTFAHPVVATYARQVRGGRLIRTVALEPSGAKNEESEIMAQISDYMVGMYADLRIRAAGLDAEAMRSIGLVRMSSIGIIEAIVHLACRTASALPKGLAH